MNYQEELYENRIEEGDFCVINYQKCWDGYSNELPMLNFMKKKGWTLIMGDFKYHPRLLRGKNIAENTIGELVFEKRRRKK